MKNKKAHPNTPKKNPNLLKNKDNNNYIALYLTLIIVLTFIAFSNCLNNGFAWDDDIQVVNNHDIRALTTFNISKIFTSYYIGMYQPLTTLSYAIEYKFAGLNPLLYHADNLLLHLLNVILVFFLIYSLTNKINISAIVVLFFGIHPMNVETVAWVSARSNLLCTLFFLGGLITYIKYVRKSTVHSLQSTEKSQSIKYYFLTLLLFIFSLLSKSAAVCFPLVLILIDYYLPGLHRLNCDNYDKSFKFQVLSFKLLLNKIPFFVIALLIGIVNIYSHKEGIADTSPSFSIIDRIFLVCYSTSFYIIKLFIPTGLCALHFYPVKLSGLLPIEYYLSAAFLAVVIVLIVLIKQGQLKKDILFGAFFYLFTIALVIQILSLGGNAITAERYSYLPYIGLVFAVGTIYDNSKIKNQKSKVKNLLIYIFLFIVVIVLSATSYNRNKVWVSSLVLYSDMIEKNPNYDEGYYNRATIYSSMKQYPEAINDYSMAIKLKPNYYDAFNNRGVANFNLKKYEEALKDYDMAIKIKPDFIDAYKNRGVIYCDLKEYNKAIEDYDIAIKLNPNYAEGYENRGTINAMLKNYKGALKDYNVLIELKPNRASAYYNRGNVYRDLKQFDKAISDYGKAIDLNSKYISAYLNRGITEYDSHIYKNAINDLEMAIQLGPENESRLRGIINDAKRKM